MIWVAKSVGANVANGALTLVVQDANGVLFDVYSASVEIVTQSGASVLAKTALDVVSSRLGLGRYAATWAPGAVAVGQFIVRWYFKRTSSASEETFSQEFELTATPYDGRAYCSVYDLRAEGLTTQMADDTKVKSWIVRAGRFVEQLTGQVFVPVYKTLELDGRGSRALLLGEPVVAIESIEIDYFTVSGSNTLSAPGETLKVFNRHLFGLIEPDDRRNPKLEFVHGSDLGGVNFQEETNSGYSLSQLIWPRGVRNIRLRGIFGYTEADGSHTGQTPSLIREATKMLVVKMMPSLLDVDARAEADQRARLTGEATRDQRYTLANPWLKGGLTGDFAIDSILVEFRRPPRFGAA